MLPSILVMQKYLNRKGENNIFSIVWSKFFDYKLIDLILNRDLS